MATLPRTIIAWVVAAGLLLQSVPSTSQIPEIDEYDFGMFVEPPWDSWKPLIYQYVAAGGSLDWHVPRYGYSLLDFAVMYHDDVMVQQLLEAGILEHLAEHWPLQSVLLHAVEEDMAHSLGLIFESASSLGLMGEVNAEEVFRYAAIVGKPAAFDVLLKFLPPPSEHQKAEILVYAVAHNGDISLVKHILGLGWNPAATFDVWSPMTYAIRHGKEEVVLALHEAGVSFESPDALGYYPLGFAVAVLDIGDPDSDYSMLDILIKEISSPCDTLVPDENGGALKLGEFLQINKKDSLDAYFEALGCSDKR